MPNQSTAGASRIQSERDKWKSMISWFFFLRQKVRENRECECLPRVTYSTMREGKSERERERRIGKERKTNRHSIAFDQIEYLVFNSIDHVMLLRLWIKINEKMAVDSYLLHIYALMCFYCLNSLCDRCDISYYLLLVISTFIFLGLQPEVPPNLR